MLHHARYAAVRAEGQTLPTRSVKAGLPRTPGTVLQCAFLDPRALHTPMHAAALIALDKDRSTGTAVAATMSYCTAVQLPTPHQHQPHTQAGATSATSHTAYQNRKSAGRYGGRTYVPRYARRPPPRHYWHLHGTTASPPQQQVARSARTLLPITTYLSW